MYIWTYRSLKCTEIYSAILHLTIIAEMVCFHWASIFFNLLGSRILVLFTLTILFSQLFFFFKFFFTEILHFTVSLAVGYGHMTTYSGP